MALVTTECVVELLGLDLCGHGQMQRSPSWGARAAGVMAEVNIVAAKSKGRKLSEKEINSIKKPILDMFAHKSEATFASAHLWDDGIIDPRKTREVVALSLEIAMNAPVQDTKFGVFRM